MTGKIVPRAWVENDKARALSLKRRRKGLLKKVKEITILCNIRACIIIFSPNKAEPMVWPSVETARGLLDDFYALPKFEQKKKEMGVESFLKEKTKTVHEKLMKSHKKNKEYATNELMMQLQHGRGIDDLNLSKIYGLLSFLKDKIILCRKNLDFMQFSPLRDPPVPPFEVQVEQLTITTNDAFVGGGQDDDKTGKTDEATSLQHHVMTLHGSVGFASRSLQHHNMNNNPIMATNQPKQYPFDFMSCELEIQEEGNNINNSQFYRSNNTVTANDDLRQEPPLNEINNR